MEVVVQHLYKVRGVLVPCRPMVFAEQDSQVTMVGNER